MTFKTGKNRKTKNWLDRVMGLIGGEPHDRETLMKMLRDAEARNLLNAEMLSMIERILQVSEMQVREVMVPKSAMVTVYKNQTAKELLPIVINSGHSRFPVVDPEDEDITGILLAKDLLKVANQDKSINELIRPAKFVPQNKRLDILLREFRINRNHLAIVIDDYGHVAGLITIEDVLEQIVGEIEDEYDIDDENGHIKKTDDGSYIIKGSTTIPDFNKYFHAKFNVQDGNTIGKYVLQTFGNMPTRGDSIKLDHFRFKVLHSDNSRIYLLEMKVLKVKK